MTVVLTIAALWVLGWQAPALPDSPQGLVVQAYLNAFNQGTAADVEKVLEMHATADAMKRRTKEERAETFAQAKKNFGTLTIDRIVSATAEAIVLAIRRLDGIETQWTFTFEPGEPVRLAGLAVARPE
jgi:hypothetical protein